MNMQTIHACRTCGGHPPKGETEALPQGSSTYRLRRGLSDYALVAQADRSP